jgi:hypothetical protein
MPITSLNQLDDNSLVQSSPSLSGMVGRYGLSHTKTLLAPHMPVYLENEKAFANRMLGPSPLIREQRLPGLSEKRFFNRAALGSKGRRSNTLP